MAASGGSANAAMLGTASANRPSFLRYLIFLYRSDATFRGVVDFTLVGTIVLLFLYFAPSREPPASSTAQKPPPAASAAQKASPAAASSQSPSVAKPASSSTTTASTVVPTGVPIQFPDEITSPSLANFTVVDINETVFKSSAPADQPRLAAAAREFRSEQFAEITKALADANAADANVAFMRAMAFVNLTGEAAKPAEPLLRAASDAGQRQASILLGRMLIRPPNGVNKDVAEGRRLIETAASAGDRLAQRLAGIEYLTNDFGGVNPTKARELFRTSAQAGDAPAMLFYAFMLGMALGGPADQPAAADLLRRSAAAGLTIAQQTLGNWLLDEFKRQAIDDPREGIEWLEKAYKIGHSVRALQALTIFYADPSHPAPWLDRKKVFELARLCSGLRDTWCQAENGWMFQNAIGTDRDLIKALAYFQVAIELGSPFAAKSLQDLDGKLKPDEEAAAFALSQRIRSNLKPDAVTWHMQYAGARPPSPWIAASDGPAAPATPAPIPAKSAPSVAAATGPQPLAAAHESALKPKDSFKECAECPEMVVVPAGTFMMGSPESERAPIEAALVAYAIVPGRSTTTPPLSTEGPQHNVTVARPFAVGRFSVTFDEWDACVTDGGCNGYRPSDQGWGRGRRPVINVNWDDAKAYVGWLSHKTGKIYRLLSEAEWEYMARAGTKTPFWWGASFSTSQANYDGTRTYDGEPTGDNRQKTLPVDTLSFSPNPWGLYQVAGNSYDWVEDCYHEGYNVAPVDGSSWTSENCNGHVVRGGAWSSAPWILRSAFRAFFPTNFRSSNHGFRVARTLAP
jgi:formylglycine-generating enzyme required for sulfatase activity/TPR repeat protein